ncbi:MAG: hypothetical protein PHC34_11050 [Candidatus Gastranaerophilales bacterium]|nr:hypothetical protein [Candidatus Gastranaerophilales bacterium]
MRISFNENKFNSNGHITFEKSQKLQPLCKTENNNRDSLLLKTSIYLAQINKTYHNSIAFKGNSSTADQLLDNFYGIANNVVQSNESQIYENYFGNSDEENKYSKFGEVLTLLKNDRPEIFKELIKDHCTWFYGIMQS